VEEGHFKGRMIFSCERHLSSESDGAIVLLLLLVLPSSFFAICG